MITGVAHAKDGKKIIMLGLSRENTDRLTAGQPIHVSAESHPGFPADISIMIVFAETQRMIADALKKHITDDTKVVTVPRDKGRVS